MKLRTVDDLLFTGLIYTYDLERQLTKALPRMVDASSSQELKRAFAVHAKETENHVKRLEQVFRLLDREAAGPGTGGAAKCGGEEHDRRGRRHDSQ